MNKFLATLLLLAILVIAFKVGGQNTVFAVTTNDISIYVDDEKVNFPDAKPYIQNSCTLVPVRTISEELGAVVDWDKTTQTVTITKDEDTITMIIGNPTMVKNSVASTLQVAPAIKDGRTMVPLRFISENLGARVEWIAATYSIKIITSAGDIRFTAVNINGGSTGIFSRKQLKFEGFDGVQADVTLPMVTIAEKGDCPYVYFGFDFKNDVGNVEGGFQFIEDAKHPNYNKWTVFMRQGKNWYWGLNVVLAQGSTHHLKFYIDEVSEKQVDLVLVLDGKEIIRKVSSVTDFSSASVKTVNSMAMSKTFDGTNCLSQSKHSKFDNLTVSLLSSDQYLDFKYYELYSEWRPTIGVSGTWFGTADCIPSYLHTETDGSISIYKGQ